EATSHVFQRQLNPTQSDPITPLPPIHDGILSLVHEHGEGVQEGQDDAASPIPLGETLAAQAPVSEETPSVQEVVAEEEAQESSSVTSSSDGKQRPYTVEIRLMKQPQMVIKTAQNSCYPVKLLPNARRMQLLAYIAWRRGKMVDRVTMMEKVFGHGR